MTVRRPLLAAVVAVVALGLAACSSSAADAGASTGVATTPSASASNPYGAAVVDPLGPDEPVLVLTGGGAGEVSLTMAQLEALGTTTITVNEPFVKAQQTFSGVPVSAVLDRAGISSASSVDTVALNDYEYTAVAGDLEASDAIIATTRDGKAIPYDQGGPIRLVYPDGTSLSAVLDAWNWSLKAIAVSGAS